LLRMLMKIPIPVVNLLKLAGIIAATLGGLYLFVLVLEYIAPFAVALVLAALIEPLTRVLSKKRKVTLSRSLSALIATILIVLVVVLLVFSIGNRIFYQARELIILLPENFPDLAQSIIDYLAHLQQLMDFLTAVEVQRIDSLLSQLGESVSGFVGNLARFFFQYAISIPEMMLFTILTILAIYYISRDWLNMQEGISKQIPSEWLDKFHVFRHDMLAALFGLIRATLIFMTITFALLYIGLSILHVQYALLISFIITIFDALPIIGAGLLLIPWIVYAFITGDLNLAIGLLIIYVLNTIVRQVIQPKILKDQIGIHPLVTVVTMYAGFKLYGLSGLIIGPVIFVVVKSVIGFYTKGRTFKQIIFEDDQ